MAGSKGTRVAVLLGGRSPEHDVSVITGLQALRAIDQTRFDAFPVYVNPRGQWFVGEALAERRNYLPDARTQGELTEVTLSLGEPGKGLLVPKRSGLFGRGLLGGGRRSSSMSRCRRFTASMARTGRSRGCSRPPTCPMPGCARWPLLCSWTRSRPSACCADRAFRCCPMRSCRAPPAGCPPPNRCKQLLANIGFPCIVKPVHLGSSIGVGKADSIEDVRALLPTIFRLDPQAIIEPFVPNLVEYNVAVTRIGGALRTSAIEQPKRAEELLDFRQKYLSGGDGKSGTKGDTANSQGMLSLTRDINPTLPQGLENSIRRWATDAFEAVSGTGAPRVDFYCNEATGEAWLNEVNPIPGSFALFPVGGGRPAARLHGAVVGADRRSDRAAPRNPAPRRPGAAGSAAAAPAVIRGS